MQFDDLDRLGHVVDPEKVRPAVQSPCVKGGGSVECAIAVGVEDFLNHGLSADAHKQRTFERKKLRKGIQQGIVVRYRFAKSKSDVRNHVCDARVVGAKELGLEVLVHLADHVAVGRIGLHRRGRALHVHHDVRRAGVRNDLPHLGVGVAARDVVDEVGTGIEGALRHRSMERVDAQKGVGVGLLQRRQNRGEARPFLFCAHERSARPCRLGPEIQDVDAILKHALSLCHSASRVVPRPAIVKRVGGEVEDAHHPSLVKTPQGTADRNRRGQDLHCNLPQVSMDTLAQYDACLATCEDLFKRKTQDYGTAWRILRPSSLTDQIFIKANRIRTIQQVGESKVDEGVESEFIGIVNYCFMAMLQCQLPENAPMELSVAEANRLYDKAKDETRALMQKKNHDYGEAWRDMRISSLTDLILMKVLRVKQIENNDGQTVVSEGVEANYMDMANYALFALILSSEQGSE